MNGADGSGRSRDEEAERPSGRARELWLSALVEGELDPHALPAELAPVLAELTETGLLRPLPGDSGLLVPVDPDLVARAREREASEALLRSLALHDQWHELSERFQRTRAWSQDGPLLRRVDGLKRINAAVTVAMSRARRRVLTMQPGVRPAEALRAVVEQEVEATGRVADRRILYMTPQRFEPGVVDFVAHLTRVGAQVRTAPFLPERIFVIDGLAIFPLVDDRSVAVFCEEPTFVHLLVHLFDMHWEWAAPFVPYSLEERESQSAAGQLTAEQWTVVSLLVERGMTVEAAARVSGWSVRTINRLMADLRARYESASLAALAFALGRQFPDGLPVAPG